MPAALLVVGGLVAGAVAAVVHDRFVDDVPGVDLALEVVHDGGDVAAHARQQHVRGGAARVREHPGGVLPVPDQRVAPHLHVVGLRERHDRDRRSVYVKIPSVGWRASNFISFSAVTLLKC